MQFAEARTSASAHNPTIFNFNKQPIQIVVKQYEPWFVASDVAKVLGYRDASNAVRLLDQDEADTHIVRIRSENGVEQERRVLIVNESGLYALVLKSRKPEAKPFRRWVTSEVLPAIRKTGQYSTVRENRTVATLTPEQQFELKEAVKRKAKTAPTHYQTIYRAIYTRYKIARYGQLPVSLLADCISFIETIDLRVPEVPKAPEPFQETEAVPMQPKRDILTRLECERLLGFVYEFKYLHKRDLDAIYDLLKAVHSPLAASFWELKESWSIGNLERVFAAHGYRVQDLDCYKHLMGFAK